MNLARRDFFRQLASRSSLKRLSALVFDGLDTLRSYLPETESLDDAGHSLRSMKPKPDRAPTHDDPDAADGDAFIIDMGLSPPGASCGEGCPGDRQQT